MTVPRRVVTGHDANGRSVVLFDGPTPRSHGIPGATFHELWSTDATPAPLTPAEPREPTSRPLVTPPDPNGTVIRIVDLEPRSRSPMHRTRSLDYGIVLAGHLTLVLDDGSRTRLGVGDIVVQRGTDHAWVNDSEEPARMAFVLVDGRFDDELARLLPADAQLFDGGARRMSERFVVTGAHGCLGAWVLAELVREDVEVVAVDVAHGVGRARLVLHEAELARVRFVRADITDPGSIAAALHGATHAVHLAALQYPYCRDDHVAGARVNVLGTLNVFDAALAAGARLVYASSIAALAEGSLYGAWKRANEGTAAAFWAEDGFPNIGIRAALVYGVGRDRGVTASMTLAMQAAAEGRPFRISHGGSSPLNHAGDLARVFVRAARAGTEGAPVYDAGGREHGMDEVVAAIQAVVPEADVIFEDAPFASTPPGFDGSALADALGGVDWRPLEQGVAETVERYRELAHA